MAYQHVVTEDITLPRVPQIVFAQDTVDLDVSCGVLNGENEVRAEVINEAGDIEVAVCRGARIED